MVKRSIFVTTGTSQYDFQRMLRLTKECLNTFREPYELIVQHGSTKNLRGLENIKVKADFLSRDELVHYYETSDFVFSHCGIGSIYNSLAYNRPTILIPRLAKYNEFSDDHQLQIAKEVSRNEILHVLGGEIEESINVQKLKKFYEFGLTFKKCQVDVVNSVFVKKIGEFLL